MERSRPTFQNTLASVLAITCLTSYSPLIDNEQQKIPVPVSYCDRHFAELIPSIRPERKYILNANLVKLDFVEDPQACV